MTAIFRDQKVKNAIMIGTLCSCSYLGVYFARNLLSAVTPQIIEGGVYSTEYIGSLSSLYFTFYAVGQLLNGAVGDKIKARYMISFGLMLAGLCNVLFPSMLDSAPAAHLTYGMTGFFLSMIYAPMTKVVAENTEPIYATRCSLGYTFASFFGSPLAGVVAAILTWQSAFYCCSAALIVMGMVCFAVLLAFERKGIVRYGQYKPAKEQGRGGVGILIRHRIIRFSFVSIITGVVRTTVVFWMPTYISQYLGFSAEKAAVTFTADTGERAVYAAQVYRISDTGSTVGGVTDYTVELILADTDGLKAGMNVDVAITIARRDSCLQLPTAAIMNNQVQVIRDGKEVAVPVSTGISGGGYTEILDGLTESDEVILP